MTPRAPFRVWVAEIATGDHGGVCGAISGICDRAYGLMDADREKGTLASGVVDGMREEFRSPY